MTSRFIATLALSCLCAVAANAQTTVGQAFNVSTTFTAACVTNNTSPATLDFGAYTAFGSAANAAPTSTISFKCSRALTLISAVFDSAGTVASSGAAGSTPTAGGVVAGLQYTLATAAAVKSTTGTAASASALGTADIFDYVVTGSMAAGQPGCISSGNSGDRCSATQTRTLTLTY